MEAELMPVVNADDLKAVFDLFRPERKYCGRHGAFTVIPGEVEAVCSPGANVEAISYRETFLNLLLTMGEPEPFLAPWIHEGYPDNKLFEVAASFPVPMPDYTVTTPTSFDLPGVESQFFEKTVTANPRVRCVIPSISFRCHPHKLLPRD